MTFQKVYLDGGDEEQPYMFELTNFVLKINYDLLPTALLLCFCGYRSWEITTLPN